jgi:hypothetical protein
MERVMKWASAASVAFVLALVSLQQARALTGTQLYQNCQDKKRGLGDLLCIAYVRGLVDGMVVGRAMGMHYATEYCPPEKGISADQARLIVEKYLRDHPEELHQEAGLIAGGALVLAFPCKH